MKICEIINEVQFDNQVVVDRLTDITPEYGKLSKSDAQEIYAQGVSLFIANRKASNSQASWQAINLLKNTQKLDAMVEHLGVKAMISFVRKLENLIAVNESASREYNDRFKKAVTMATMRWSGMR